MRRFPTLPVALALLAVALVLPFMMTGFRLFQFTQVFI